MKLWSKEIPKPWHSLADISNSNLLTRKLSISSSSDNSVTSFISHPEPAPDEDTPTTANLMITEPHLWSRLKILYSFEYKEKL